MTIRAELLHELEAAVEEAERTRMWGSIELCFQNGVAYALKKSSSKKLCSEAEKNSRANKPQI
jgi:hypothetical protein